MENEEAFQRGLVGAEELADEEGESDRRHEKNDEKDVGDGRAEVAEKLAFEDGGYLGHGGGEGVGE